MRRDEKLRRERRKLAYPVVCCIEMDLPDKHLSIMLGIAYTYRQKWRFQITYKNILHWNSKRLDEGPRNIKWTEENL